MTVEVFTVFQDGLTPLHLASANGHADVCSELISAKASVDATNKVSLSMLVVLHPCNPIPSVCAPAKRCTGKGNEHFLPGIKHTLSRRN